MARKATEIDKDIAEKIMGLVVVKDDANYRGYSVGQAGPHGEDLPCYSEDVKHAMMVFDRMREKGFRWLLNADSAGFHLRNVVCVHQNDVEDEKEYTCDRPLGTAKELGNLPRMICEAALKEMSEIVNRS